MVIVFRKKSKEFVYRTLQYVKYLLLQILLKFFCYREHLLNIYVITYRFISIVTFRRMHRWLKFQTW